MVFQPGQSGNPGGRPKTKRFTEALSRVLDDPDTLHRIAIALVAKGMEGDVPALREIADRLEGKVPQAIVGDDDHDPIRGTLELIQRVIVDNATDRDSQSLPAPPGAEPV